MQKKKVKEIMEVHRRAFGQSEGEEIAELAKNILDHPDAISISVERDGKMRGNVLFSPFIFSNHSNTKCYLLAPCGVEPEYQGRGLGKELMEKSIDHLKSIGADAVFVLGVPTFYPRYGYEITSKQTPYPELLTIKEAWMALELTKGTVDRLSGQTTAIPQLIQPFYWDTSAHEG